MSDINAVGGTKHKTGIRVVLYTPDPSRHKELVTEIAGKRGFRVEVVTSREALDAAVPDAQLALIAPPCGSDVARLVSDIVIASPATRVVVLRTFDDVQNFYDCLMAGAVGFCSPAAGAKAIVRTMRAVMEDGVAIPRSMVRPLVEGIRHGRGHAVETPSGVVELTQREWEVLLLLRQRRTTREMSEQLFVSPATVRSHVSAVLNKLGVGDREAAIDLLDPAEGHVFRIA